MRLLGTNYKLEKAVPGYQLFGLSLAPHSLGGPNLCPHSTPECRAVCLGTEAGMNRFPVALNAKLARTELFHKSRPYFEKQLVKEIEAYRSRAAQSGHKLGIRLNVYSDIQWEREWPALFERFPDVQFYDYTKIPARFERPKNYHLTYSYSGTEASKRTLAFYYEHGINIAMVFNVAAGKPLPKTWKWGQVDMPVIDGDLSDFRPGDPKGVVVGLRFKGGQLNLKRAPKFVTLPVVQ